MNATLYVAATGCQWQALTRQERRAQPSGAREQRRHLEEDRRPTPPPGPRTGTHDPDPLGGHHRRARRGDSLRPQPGSVTPAKGSRDAKCLGIVDTFELLLAVVVVAGGRATTPVE